MEQVDLKGALEYLLPGFLSAWVFYSFTSFPKPSQFERVVQALIFTVIIQGIVFLEKTLLFLVGRYWQIGVWGNNTHLVFATASAVILGLAFSYFANTDKFHKIVRRVGITKQRSFPSEWYGVFSEQATYIVLHFKDERRLYGWVREWPSQPTSGHFVVEEPSWLLNGSEITLDGVKSVLVNVTDVMWVEFMNRTWENGTEAAKPSASSAT